MRKCRFCTGPIEDAATVCPHCTKDLFPKRTPPVVVAAPVDPAAAAYALARLRRSERYCPTCGTVGAPKRGTKGSFAIELVLWICMIVPGLLYSVWRLSTRDWVCATCGAGDVIPVDSPKALQELAAAAAR